MPYTRKLWKEAIAACFGFVSVCLVFCFCFSRWQRQGEIMVTMSKVAELSSHSQKYRHSMQCCASLQAQGCWSWMAGNHRGEFQWIWAKVIHFVLLCKSCSQCSAWVQASPDSSVMPLRLFPSSPPMAGWASSPRSALLQTCSTRWAGYRKTNTCLCLIGYWTNIIIFGENKKLAIKNPLQNTFH